MASGEKAAYDLLYPTNLDPVDVAEDTGVTVYLASRANLREQHSTATLIKLYTNSCLLAVDLST